MKICSCHLKRLGIMAAGDGWYESTLNELLKRDDLTLGEQFVVRAVKQGGDLTLERRCILQDIYNKLRG